jgi:hypothetical protein
MKKPDREELYKAICRRIGTMPRESALGYFSREEMLELLTYLGHVDKILGQIESLKGHPTFQNAIKTGEIQWPTGLKD